MTWPRTVIDRVADVKEEPTKPGQEPLLPVFVVGVPRSGTTWVQRILASHPQAWPLLETYMFSRRSGLGALFRTFPPELVDSDPYALAAPGLGRIYSRTELVAEVRAIAERWLSDGCIPGSRFAIEKSPWHLSDLELIAEILPRARFVHVIRDGRDVAVSLLAARRSWSRYGDSRASSTIREAARVWSDGIEQGELARAVIGERLLEVRYEALHADPDAEIRRLFEHCAMPHDEQLVERTVAATEFERRPEPRGENMALRAGRVGDWRRRLGMAHALMFERIAGPTLRATGYEPDSRWWLRRPLRAPT